MHSAHAAPAWKDGEVSSQHSHSSGLAKFAWLSIGAAVATISLKTLAYLLTGSVGLLSDAMESVVNLVAAVIALAALTFAARPADNSHRFGHGKVQYLSAGAEGVMILVAAVLIIWQAIGRLIAPEPLDSVGIGLTLTLLATVINLLVGLLLIRIGRRERSLILEADGKHLMTDVWTTVGVVVGVTLVALTGWLRLDPLIAIAVAVNILITGGRLIRLAGRGLLDAALPEAEQQALQGALEPFASDEVHFHGITGRESGSDRFVSMHVLVPGAWTVQQAHNLIHDVEEAIEDVLPGARVETHVEPSEDPRSYDDYEAGMSVGTPSWRRVDSDPDD